MLSSHAAQSSRVRRSGLSVPGVRHVERRLVHHDLHHAEDGDEQPPQRLALLGLAQGAGRRGGVRRRVVAGAADRGEQARDARRGRVPDDGGALRRVAGARLEHARLGPQRPLDRAGAAGTPEAGEAKVGAADAPAVAGPLPAREAGLQLGIVGDRRFAVGAGRRRRRASRGSGEGWSWTGFEAGGDDRGAFAAGLDPRQAAAGAGIGHFARVSRVADCRSPLTAAHVGDPFDPPPPRRRAPAASPGWPWPGSSRRGTAPG